MPLPVTVVMHEVVRVRMTAAYLSSRVSGRLGRVISYTRVGATILLFATREDPDPLPIFFSRGAYTEIAEAS